VTPLRVAIVGCGLIGRKRAEALAGDRLVGCYDVVAERAEQLAADHAAPACSTLDELLDLRPDVTVVATTNDSLSEVASHVLARRSHALVEKPGGRTVEEVDAVAAAAAAAGRLVKVGFNHRFYPGIRRAAEEALSGAHGPIMFVRARYGHGGRVGYETEWRANPDVAGGGELLDQGAHLLDLSHWLLGPLPLHDALVRANFWDMEVEDNAVVVLADPTDRRGPWSTFHVSWSEWKNEFAFEIYCRRAKLQVSGRGGSYGAQALRIFRMKPQLGPPEVEELHYDGGDESWAAEWAHFRQAIDSGGTQLVGDLASARYALAIVAEVYRRAGWPRSPQTASEPARAGERVSVTARGSLSERADGASAFFASLETPPGRTTLPAFDGGWRADSSAELEAFLTYMEEAKGEEAGWSAELEELHEEATRIHFLDVWTRAAALRALDVDVPHGAAVADLGCSSGHMLEELAARFPHAQLVGVDVVARALARAHARVPSAALFLASVTELPFADATLDGVVALNLLEHLPDDEAALAEIRRVLAPGARAVVVVPANPRLYDFYDVHLRHERRYARGELAGKAAAAGLRTLRRSYLGGPIYPAFWATKKLNRRRHRRASLERQRELVATSIARTQRSRVGALSCALERRVLGSGRTFPFGVRELLVLEASP
jgi:predicted dehydrogenase/SAM-dependent methyltransferase